MIVVCNLAISICSRPVGNTLFIAAKLARVSVERTSLALVAFILINIVTLLLITYYPPFSLWLPSHSTPLTGRVAGWQRAEPQRSEVRSQNKIRRQRGEGGREEKHE